MSYHYAEFPYEEIRDRNGDFYDSQAKAMEDQNVTCNHVWSIVEGDRYNIWVYGPSHHYVNVIGFVVTKEEHDGDTYFEEKWG